MDATTEGNKEGNTEGMELKVRDEQMQVSDVGSFSPAEAGKVEQMTEEATLTKRKRLENEENGDEPSAKVGGAGSPHNHQHEDEASALEEVNDGLQVKTATKVAEASLAKADGSSSEGLQQTNDVAATKVVEAPRNPRYKKRKIAIFISYSGFGYQGMQKNKGAITIEGELEEALFKAGAIAESNFGDPKKVDWARAARTDKGVSAVGQVVSGRFFIDPPGFMERVNSHLPKQIRVLGFKRVTGSFSAKRLCDRRRYEYVLPVYALDPSSHRNADGEEQASEADGEKSEDGEETRTGPVCTCETDDTGFVFGEEQRVRLNRILQNYVGTHNFHNFTCRIKPEDPSTQRYIISYEAGDVFEIDGSKFVRCTVVGQSFMLHQIRKMIGLAVAVMRGCAPESIYESAFRRDVKIGVPMAPELGLFLDECLYASYNQRNAGTHEELSLKEFEKETSAFKAEVIYPHIASTDSKERAFARWLHGLTDKRYPDLAAENKRE